MKDSLELNSALLEINKKIAKIKDMVVALNDVKNAISRVSPEYQQLLTDNFNNFEKSLNTVVERVGNLNKFVKDEVINDYHDVFKTIDHEVVTTIDNISSHITFSE